MLKISPAPKSAGTRITFALPADHPAGSVSVVGNFNDWTPGRDPLRRRSNGTMSAVVTVPADYIVVFRYLGEGGLWFDEPDADFVDEGAGVLWARDDAPAPRRAKPAAARPTRKAA